MAFASAVDFLGVVGSRRMATGTFTNAGTDSGGTINTGLKHCHTFVYSCNSHLGSESVKVTKNPSGSPGQVTVVTSDDMDADWIAFGI